MSSPFQQHYQQWRDQCQRVDRLDKVFLVGCAKSGTTWLMNLLNGHPQMVFRGEGAFSYQLVPMLAQAFAAFNKHQQAKDPITHLRDQDLKMTVRTLVDSQLARYVQASDRDESALRVVGDKTPQHTITLPELDCLYPDAKFIHIIRDPRDVATSAWFHFGIRERRPFEEFIPYYIKQVWPINVSGARRAASKLGNRYREVSYERLHDQEADELKTILEFLDVDASDQAVQACQNAGDFQKRSGGRQRGQADQGSFYRSGTIGDWRNHLPLDLVEACCESIAPLMSACGYDPVCAETVAAK